MSAKTHHRSPKIKFRQLARPARKAHLTVRRPHTWRYAATFIFLLSATFGALAASNRTSKLGRLVEAVPTLVRPVTANSSSGLQAHSSKPKEETYLELDLSHGKGLFTAWRIVPSNDITVLNTGRIELTSALRRGDNIRMSDGLIALVTKAQKHVDAHHAAANKSLSNGDVTNRVVGWSKHITDTLLYLQTPDELVKTTPEHPFFVHGKGWVRAANLRKGEQIETGSTRLVTVVDTQIRHERQAVYNLDVENTHTFFVGKDALLVHNGDCVPDPANLGELMNGASLNTTQANVSRDFVNQYVDMLLNGSEAPAIKVDGSTIVEGNHRYIADILARLKGYNGPPLEIAPGVSPRNVGPIIPWGQVKWY